MEIDDVSELFREVALGNAGAVARMVHFRPELARARDRNGLSVLAFARYAGQPEVLRALVDAGQPLDIFEAAAIDDTERVARLACSPSVRDARDAAGLTALHHAARAGARASIRMLVDAGADVNARVAERLSPAPLHLAVQAGHVEAVRLLLRAGADPNARAEARTTPLMIAAAANAREIVECLLARNALCEITDAGGVTAGDVAAAHGHRELAARLHVGERLIDRSMG